MKTFLLSIFLMISLHGHSQENNNKVSDREQQIKVAVLPAPEEQRDQVTVYGYDETGKLIVLREGSGNLVCLADDPNTKGIEVSCYSKKLDPFMARGRELKAEGKGVKEIREIRKQEVDSRLLKMPDVPSMLYILTSEQDNLDPETGELKDARFRYVIYTPFATTESTGLPDKPHAPGMPWLMDPGTHRAHIMITPAVSKN